MTKPVRSRILKDANGDISDHLRNHIHLTNCIHLKNHMHKNSPILADRSLMRDLIALQKSHSLRDPSASPRSWHSPSVVDLLPRKGDNDVIIGEGRRSVGIERRRDGRRSSASSPPFVYFGTSKVAPGEIGLRSEGVAGISERSSKTGANEGKKVKKVESSHKSNRNRSLDENEEPPQDQGGNAFGQDVVSGNSEAKSRRSKQKQAYGQDIQVKTLSQQLHDFAIDSDGVVSSNVLRSGRHYGQEKAGEQPEPSIRGHSGRVNRAKRRKFRGTRRTKASTASRDVKSWNEMSVASNSYAQGSVPPKYHRGEEDEYGDHNVTRAPRNGCGIPWNWSRIHDRGRKFVDLAGRSFSCGLSESRLKGGAASHSRDIDMSVTSEHSSSSTKSDAEALPLLVEASMSQESSENAGWLNDYSGELGIYADHLLKHGIDSDLAPEAQSGGRHKSGGKHLCRHQNLTQKYMPRTFRDLVGQNLVAQALSNAVTRKKVGLLYVFYGPHGNGKTSSARIFARALNCQSVDHQKPCSFCKSCLSHDVGKNRHIREVGPLSNFDFEGIVNLLDTMIVSQLPSQYRVFIFDDCDTLSPDCWSAITKVIDRAPRRVVFILVCSSLDVLPHIITSRCQKFFFPKLKDADIIYTLQWISSREGIDIDKDALKLIASRSDGSLRDAEMTLEQLSLLGQNISVTLVQELVGLISDEKLVDLLDLALSADTVNTVKNLRVIMETGVEPLALMSQLATVITDILAGSYDLAKDRHRRKFFRRRPLSKEDMEKLRQALKTLSEAEKQLRMSNDKLTWLTAALLQLAPDKQYTLPSSSAGTSFNHSPLVPTNARERVVGRKSVELAGMANNVKGFPSENMLAGSSEYFPDNTATKDASVDKKRHSGVAVASQQASALSADVMRVYGRQVLGRSHKEIDQIWLEVLEKIQSNGIKDFLFREGKLMSVSFGAAPTVQLMLSSHLTKAKAEKFSAHILQAFESVLGSPVTIEIRCEPKKDSRADAHVPVVLPASRGGPSLVFGGPETNYGNRIIREPLNMGRSEIVELPPSPLSKSTGHAKNSELIRVSGNWGGEASTSLERPILGSAAERSQLGEQTQSLSLARSKVSLASVIQQAEGQSGWSRRKAVSIAEKLEQENLRLEPRSRRVLCWKASKATRRKLSRLKIRPRRPSALLKLVSCGRCLSAKSTRSRLGPEINKEYESPVSYTIIDLTNR